MGWTKYAGGCYALFGDKNSDSKYRDKLSWEEANAKCGEIWNGASLAIMPNVHYQWFFTSMLATAEGKTRGNPWIGITVDQSKASDHQFHWVDNTKLQFTNWAENEPNGKVGNNIEEDVVEVFSHTHPTGDAGQWIDNDRTLKRAFMCSHQSVANEISTGATDCPDGWIQLRHHCYKLFTSPLSFSSAQESCQNAPKENGLDGKSGELVSVIDEYEFNLARSLLYPDLDVLAYNDGSDESPGAWIGLTGYRQNTGSPTTGDIIFEWTDQSHFTSTFWAANQPNQTHIAVEPEKTCFFMNLPTGAWANSGSTTCNTELPYVCKINIDDNAPSRDDDRRGDLMDCPVGYTPIDDRCVLGFEPELNWFDAEAKCNGLLDVESGRNLNAHLASIHSETKNTALVSFFQNYNANTKTPFWAGATREGGSNQVDGMVWTDGSEFSYMKWDVNEPSYEWNGHAEDCLTVKGSGYWNDDHCDTDKHGYICEFPRTWSNCAAITPNITEACGDDDMVVTTERQCDVLNCCWDSAADIQCYKPKGYDSSSMSITVPVFTLLISIILQ